MVRKKKREKAKMTEKEKEYDVNLTHSHNVIQQSCFHSQKVPLLNPFLLKVRFVA